MASQQKRHHWDKRKRRYIQLQPKEEVKAGKRLKTESGARAKSNNAPSGLYEKWAKAHKRRIATPGEEENGAAAAYSKNLSNRFKKGGRGWVNPAKSPSGPAGGKSSKSELRTMDEVRRNRKEAERKKSRQSGGKTRGGGAGDAGDSSRPTGSGTRFSKSTHGPPASARGGRPGSSRGRGGMSSRGGRGGGGRSSSGRGGSKAGPARGKSSSRGRGSSRGRR